MKTFIQSVLYLLTASALTVAAPPLARHPASSGPARGEADFEAAVAAQPKLLRISGQFDGSGRIVFTRKSVRYEHKHWARPARVLFDGEPWRQLERTPPPWTDFGGRLDLSRARVVQRQGRDVVALEQTADGFDLYICDSPNGASHYAITLAIPRR